MKKKMNQKSREQTYKMFANAIVEERKKSIKSMVRTKVRAMRDKPGTAVTNTGGKLGSDDSRPDAPARISKSSSKDSLMVTAKGPVGRHVQRTTSRKVSKHRVKDRLGTHKKPNLPS